MSKRAEVRRKRAERKKAAEDAKWAEVNRNRLWIREQRKKLGLPVDDPTPSPTEAAYRERVTKVAAKASARTLRKRVRRVSHQLLVAAAIGKQCREAATADHSGHSVPSANRTVPLKPRRVDARSDTSLSAAKAMACSFRNWANREKSNRSGSRSHTPSTVVVSSRTTGPEDTPSGSDRDSSFTDDDRDADVAGAMALIYDTKFWGEDDSDDSDDDASGLASLDFNDVSDDIKVAARAMVAAAENSQGDDEDWADILATQVLEFLHASPSTPPASPELDLSPDSDTGDGDSTDLSGEAKAALKNFRVSPNLKGAANVNSNNKDKPNTTAALPWWDESIYKIYGEGRGNRPSWKKLKQQQKLKKALKIRGFGPGRFKATMGFAKQQQQQQQGQAQQLPTPVQTPSLPSGKPDTQGWLSRKPNKPAAPCQSVWDPTRWRINTKDADDSIWAGKAAKYKQPTEKMETGFMTWGKQETRFPHLDARLLLYDARRPMPMIFDPATVDTQVWDPLNRAITEPRTGKRAPLRLNAVTTHSLARWTAAEFGNEYPLDPIRLPDSPATEDKKRPLPSVTFSAPKEEGAERRKMAGKGQGLFGVRVEGEGGRKTVAFAPSSLATPTKETPRAETDQSAAVASIHYPLKSPGPQSISKAHPAGLHDAAGSAQQQLVAFGAIAGLRFPPRAGFHAPGPPTPYPRIFSSSSSSSVPDTPTVALYERPETPPGSDAPSSADEAGGEEDAQLAAFPQGIRSDGGGGGENDNGKRTAADDGDAETPGAAKKRKMDGGGEGDALGLGFLGAEHEHEHEHEELQMSDPSLVHEYHAARADDVVVVDGDGAASERAGSRLKAVLDEKSAATSAEAWDVGVAGDAVDADAGRGLGEPPVYPISPSKMKTKHRGGEKKKKSVRFDIRRDEGGRGPSAGMRDGARRALGRYDLTSSRRGPLGPFW